MKTTTFLFVDFICRAIKYLGAGYVCKKADFAHSKEYGAVGFSIGSKGYSGTGSSIDCNYKMISGELHCRGCLDAAR